MSERKSIHLQVKGMTCQGCVNAVTRVIKKSDPQADVKIDLASGKVDVESAAEASAIAAAIDKAGYSAQVR